MAVWGFYTILVSALSHTTIYHSNALQIITPMHSWLPWLCSLLVTIPYVSSSRLAFALPVYMLLAQVCGHTIHTIYTPFFHTYETDSKQGKKNSSQVSPSQTLLVPIQCCERAVGSISAGICAVGKQGSNTARWERGTLRPPPPAAVTGSLRH